MLQWMKSVPSAHRFSSASDTDADTVTVAEEAFLNDSVSNAPDH